MPGAAAPTRPRARALYARDRARRHPGGSRRGRDRSATRPARIYRQFGDIRGVAATMTAMAWQAQRQGRYAEATALFGETVSLWEQLGERPPSTWRAATWRTPPRRRATSTSRAPARAGRRRVAGAGRRPRRRVGAQRPRRRRGVAGRSRRRPALPSSEPGQVSPASTIGGVLRASCPTWPASISRRATTTRRIAAQGGAAGVSRARPPARRRPSARIAGVVRRLPGARRRGGDAGERGGGDPPADRHAGQAGRARDASTAR